MKYLITSLLLMCSVASVHAQSEPTATPDPQCLFATDKAAWMSLDLTSDELERVQDLQTACTTDCTAMKKKTNEETTLGAVVEQYMNDVHKVLGDKRYEQWLQWCKGRPVKG